MIQIRISPTSQRDLARVSKKLRMVGAPKEIRRELVSGMREAAKPAERDVKSEARTLPAHGGQSTGLRRRIANAVSIKARTGGRSAGVKLRVSRARMGDQAALPHRMNKGSWRHPVFDTGTWVKQESRAGWFDRTARGHRGTVRQRLKRVIDGIERKLR